MSLEDLQIPRCYKQGNHGTITAAELHDFSDASFKGYGQFSYLRLVASEKHVSCSFVIGTCGKARVCLLKQITVPQLELTAAVLSVRTSQFLKQELELDSVKEHFWTASQIVLSYIANESRRFQIFVANRIQTIHDHTQVEQWHYVNTACNPADEASRGLSAEDLKYNSMWCTDLSSYVNKLFQNSVLSTILLMLCATIWRSVHQHMQQRKTSNQVILNWRGWNVFRSGIRQNGLLVSSYEHEKP